MWLLRTMLWSGLFDRFEILQATAIWWMNDVDGGGLFFWPHGPDQPPEQHVGAMANTALIGDNHGMFHQVGPVGPFDRGTPLVSPSAELAPLRDGTGDWAVHDHDELMMRAPLGAFRVSVLWKADIYASASERAARKADQLSLQHVADMFNEDLAGRGWGLRLDLARLNDPAHRAEVAAAYPEARPVGAMRSVFDAA
jgi:hypothetical protein